jgi:glycosyltransferase involved in cell wall biosynthesis
MLTIAVDTWTLQSRFRNSGIYFYSRKMLQEFQAIAASQGVVISPFQLDGINNDAESLRPSPGFSPRRAPLLRYSRSWRFGGASFSGRGADLIFCPSNTSIPIGKPPVVTTIHDVTPIVSPSIGFKTDFAARTLLWAACRWSRHILANSECTKRDIVRCFRVPESKVSVVYHAYDHSTYNTDPVNEEVQSALRKRFAIRPPYLIHHGAVQPRKNLQRLIEAFGVVRRKAPELQLVLAGPLGWNYEGILAAAESDPVRGSVILTGALSSGELATLVKGADLEVVPSLYEGFCVPMVEAMACGTPVIASNNSCLPEVSGGLLRYFDPLSIDEMSRTILQVLDSESLRGQLRSQGLARAVEFSWERCAKATLELLRQAAGEVSHSAAGVRS